MINIKQIKKWFEKAVPTPTIKNACVQIGCHYEEIDEMQEVLCDDIYLAKASAELYKSKDEQNIDYLNGLTQNQKIELLDSLCDQIVTAIGCAHMLEMDIGGALQEVANSNDSKFVDGKPIFNEQGKIMKGDNYFKPELAKFIKSDSN